MCGWQIERKKVGTLFVPNTIQLKRGGGLIFIGLLQNLLNIYCNNVMKYCGRAYHSDRVPTTRAYIYSRWTKGRLSRVVLY